MVPPPPAFPPFLDLPPNLTRLLRNRDGAVPPVARAPAAAARLLAAACLSAAWSAALGVAQQLEKAKKQRGERSSRTAPPTAPIPPERESLARADRHGGRPLRGASRRTRAQCRSRWRGASPRSRCLNSSPHTQSHAAAMMRAPSVANAQPRARRGAAAAGEQPASAGSEEDPCPLERSGFRWVC